jgi:hypothetical protein
MRLSSSLVLAVSVSLAACADAGGSPAETCGGPGSGLIHVLDDQGRLLSFDPALVGVFDPFKMIGAGPLGCLPGPALAPFTDPAGPYALAVDRAGDALVLYTSGELFRVSTVDASCETTSFAPGQEAGGVTWSLFGMAFTTTGSGGDAERLWLSGGAADSSLGALGYVDPPSFAVSTVGSIGAAEPMRPELMGAGDGTLWGYFPGGSAVQQIDGETGGLLGSPHSVAPGGAVFAWGAAQWGGKFWVFLSVDPMTPNSTVRTIDRASGADALVEQNLTHVVVAAASSTCAPWVP